MGTLVERERERGGGEREREMGGPSERGEVTGIGTRQCSCKLISLGEELFGGKGRGR